MIIGKESHLLSLIPALYWTGDLLMLLLTRASVGEKRRVEK